MAKRNRRLLRLFLSATVALALSGCGGESRANREHIATQARIIQAQAAELETLRARYEADLARLNDRLAALAEDNERLKTLAMGIGGVGDVRRDADSRVRNALAAYGVVVTVSLFAVIGFTARFRHAGGKA